MFNVYCLMWWVIGQGKVEVMVEEFFDVFFRCILDIGDLVVLISCVEVVGLECVIIEDLLVFDCDEKVVWDEEMFYCKFGVFGVFIYIFNGQFVVLGVQDFVVFVDVI